MQVDLMQNVFDFWQRIHPDNPALVVPALSPPGANLSTATAFMDEAMVPSKFNKVLPELVRLAANLPLRAGALPSSKSLRRTSQSLCEVCDLQLHERLAFGTWQDDLTERPSRRHSSTSNMPHVYTDALVTERTQLDAKHFVWKPLLQALWQLGDGVADATWQGALATALKAMCSSARMTGHTCPQPAEAEAHAGPEASASAEPPSEAKVSEPVDAEKESAARVCVSPSPDSNSTTSSDSAASSSAARGPEDFR